MKRFKVQKAYLAFMFILAVFMILPGCGGGVAGDGSWYQPVYGTIPTVSSTNPANYDTNVPILTLVTAVFSEAMDPATITATTFTVKQGTTDVPGAVTYSGVTAVFTPTNPLLAPNSLFICTITTGAKSSAGTLLASNYVWVFTTGATPDTTPPTVSFTAPANGATAVDHNRLADVAFSEAMDPTTITTATLSIKETISGTNVAGTVTPVGSSAIFRPSASLAYSTGYTGTVTTGAKDLSGNALASNYVWTFTTGAIPDTIAPTVSITSPTNTAIVVPINRKLGVGFSEAMDPLTINTATFKLTRPGLIPFTVTSVPGTVTAVGPSATFTPATPLEFSTTYTATIIGGSGGVKDLAVPGNALATNFVWSFTTSAIADIIPPTVSFTAPLNGQTAVPVNRIIHVGFSEAMDPSTITTTNFKVTGPGVTPVSGTVAAVGTSATFTPSTPLAFSTIYTATITAGVKDLAVPGNALANNYVWSFTTGAAPDNTAPTVSFTAPSNGQTDVPVNRIINVAFSEVMDPLTITTASFMLKGPGLTPVPGIVTPAGNSATFTPTFIPVSPLANNTTYTGTITTQAKDLAGNPLAANYVWSFTTGAAPDIIAPTVSVTSPTDTAVAVPVNRQIHVGFSEDMEPSTITTLSFKITGPGVTPVPGTVSSLGTSALFTPANALLASTKYTGTITNGVKDLAGNPMLNNYLFTFTTGIIADTTKPTVTGTINANGATGVSPNTKIGATFSEAMDTVTITSATFTVKRGATTVPGTVNYSGVNAVFTPTSVLNYDTTYTGTITTGARDLAGNPLAGNQAPLPAASDYVWSFTTGSAPDISRPIVLSTTPANLASAVATNSSVNATFSEPMNPSSISTSTFSVAGVTGTVNYSAGIATFTPLNPLDINTTYTATITTGACDLAGNQLAGNQGALPSASNYVWSFTTGNVAGPPPASHLGTAAANGIMATSAITNTGASTNINGDVAMEPGSANDLLPAQVNGAIHINDPVSHQAYADLLVAYNYYKTLPPGVTITAGADLGALYPLGMPPGTYTSGTTMAINTLLTLDGGGNANAIWVFQIGSSITTTTPLGSIVLKNGANANNIFWVPTASATIGVGTTFYGNVIAGVSITGQTGAIINGRLLAGAIGAGTIALDTNTVNVP